MKFQKVKSKMISEVAYDGEANVLHVKFPNGKHYAYFEVEPHLHADMMAAESIGSFFGEHVRGKFAYRMIETEKQH